MKVLCQSVGNVRAITKPGTLSHGLQMDTPLRLVVGHSAAVLGPDKQSAWDETLGDPDNLPVYLTRLQKRARSGGGTVTETKGVPFLEHCEGGFDESCPTCRALLAGYLCCMFAGGAATSILLPTEHAAWQTSDDREQVREMLQKAFADERQRTIVRGEAEQQAYTLISRESNAVRAVARELSDRGALCGCEAERITREHLIGLGR